MTIATRVALHAMLSKLSYSSPAKVKETWKDCTSEHVLLQDFMKNVRMEPIFIDSPTPYEDTQVYVFNHDDCVYVSFRGSSSTADFIADIDIRRYCLDNECSVPIPSGVTLHQGFYEQYRVVQDQLFAKLEDLLEDRDDIPISICGHSLGASLGQIAAAHISSYPSFKSHKVSCITFGGPRVGNRAFSAWYESCVDTPLRIVHWYDPIPNLPILPFWQHTNGECIYFTKTKTRIMKRDLPWFQRVYWILKYVMPWSVLYLKDHAMDVYVDIWLERHDNQTS